MINTHDHILKTDLRLITASALFASRKAREGNLKQGIIYTHFKYVGLKLHENIFTNMSVK